MPNWCLQLRSWHPVAVWLVPLLSCAQHSLNDDPVIDCLMTVSGSAPCRPPAARRAPLRRLAPLLAAVPMLTGCLPAADPLDPALDVPAGYRAPQGTAKAELPSAEWWREFRSGELTDLVEQAQAANLDIAAAVARITQADALARISGASLLPSFTLNASDTRSRSSTATVGGTNALASGAAIGGGGNRTAYNVALNASYEIDFWGKNQAALRAATDSAAAARFDREVIALSTLSTVANTYLLVLSAQDRVRIAKENLTSATRILNIVRDRFNVGAASTLEVAQQESLAAVVRASIPPLVEQDRQNRAVLALLVGRAPEHITVRGGSLLRLTVPRVTPGLPSSLLMQRPDIREAEMKLASADANVEAARAAVYPSIQLTGQGGFARAGLNSLFSPGAAFYSVTAGLTQPVFDGFRLRGQLDQQKGIREELLQNYRKSVISAFTDVEKTLIALRQTTEQERLERDAVIASRRAFEISEERLRAGTVDLTTVLTAEQTLFQQEDTLAQIQLARFQAVVSLFQALGGGWTPNQPTRAVDRGSLRP